LRPFLFEAVECQSHTLFCSMADFIRRKLGSSRSPVDAAAISELAERITQLPCLCGMRLHRVYFYDAEPRRQVLQKEGPRIEIGGEDFEPDIRQKGVDMRIGLDIASLTLKRQVQVIVLVTADSDFVPAMKFARREGAQLFLITLGHGIRDGMRAHADLVVEDFPLAGPAAGRVIRQATDLESVSS
jgi:hypothetical protein